MKKIISLSILSTALLLAACGDESAPAAAATPAPSPAPVKEVVIVKPAPAVVVKEAPPKQTVISVNKDGVKVGTKKVEVVVGKDHQ